MLVKRNDHKQMKLYYIAYAPRINQFSFRGRDTNFVLNFQ